MTVPQAAFPHTGSLPPLLTGPGLQPKRILDGFQMDGKSTQYFLSEHLPENLEVPFINSH